MISPVRTACVTLFISILCFSWESEAASRTVPPVSNETTCKTFLNAARDTGAKFQGFVEGFITGFRMAGESQAGTGGEFEISIDRVMPMLEKSCGDSPDKKFIPALLRVCKDLQLY